MASITNDQEVFDTLRDRLSTSIVSDALGMLGAREQSMVSDVRPIYQGAIVVGRARPVLVAEIYDVNDESFCNMLDVVNSLKSNDVLVIGCNRSMRAGVWGEMLATAARVRGASGAVCDGATRDIAALTAMKFPSFARGAGTLHARGRMMTIDNNCPVSCGGVVVKPRDIIFGDMDGVVVIPEELMEKVIPLAVKIRDAEAQFHDKLLKGENVRGAFNAVFKDEYHFFKTV